MKADLELFALLAAMLMGAIGFLIFCAAIKEYKKSPGKNNGHLFVKCSVVIFIISGMFLIPGWDYPYTSGFWQRPQESKQANNSPKSKPIIQVMREEYQKEQTNVQSASQPTAPVYNNGWDGSVRQVKEWLKDNLKDPDSFEAINWSPVQTNFDGGYYVRCKYRAKNSFGGYDIANQIFYMDSKGNVLRYVDANE